MYRSSHWYCHGYFVLVVLRLLRVSIFAVVVVAVVTVCRGQGLSV